MSTKTLNPCHIDQLQPVSFMLYAEFRFQHAIAAYLLPFSAAKHSFQFIVRVAAG